MNEQELRECISERFPKLVPEENMAVILKSVAEMHPEVRPKLEEFLRTGMTPPYELEGYDVARLMHEHGMHELAAYMTLSWLKKDPVKALKSLQN
jgi:hypothetical protein